MRSLASQLDRLGLPDSVDKLHSLLETVPGRMLVIDDRGTVLALGRDTAGIFGYADDELIGRNISMLMSPTHASRHDDYLERYRRTGQRHMIGATRVESARHADGHLFPIEISIGELRVDTARHFIGYVRELGREETSQRQLQSMLSELAHVSRVSAMATLATAIAHELNQPLTSIANYTEGMRDLLSKRPDIAESDEFVAILDKCSRQAVRAGQLLHRIRDFMKGGEPQRRPVKVRTLVEDSMSLALINGFKRAVKIAIDIPDGLPPVLIDRLQGQQVLFNLITNAFDAMHVGDGAQHRMAISARRAYDKLVEITVEDSGQGIAEPFRETMFDSFVTTKGEGMGVGLAICRQIVEAHGGHIWGGEPGRLGGAAIHFTLPVAEDADTEA